MKENFICSERSLYVENREKWLGRFEEDFLIKDTVKALEVENGYILPLRKTHSRFYEFEGGVCDSNMKFVTGIRRKVGAESFTYSCNRGYVVPEESVEVSEESVVFGGILFQEFGHLLLESLSRLWWFVENPDCKKKIIFLTLPNQKAWCYDFFRLLNIPLENIVIVEKPTKFANIIVPDETIHAWSGFKDKYIHVYNAIRSNVKPANYKKIYLTRSALQPHDCINEEYFEEFYRKRGYEIISPEKYSVEEQISFMAGADEVVCVLGTLSHLALFCKPKTKFIVLNRTKTDVLTPQIIINQANNIDVRFIDVSMNFLPTTHVWGCFLLAPTTHWENYLRSDGIDFTEDELKVDIEKISYEYLTSWCKNYSNKRNFRKINEFDLFDVVNSIHHVLLGSPVARKDLQGADVPSKNDLVKKNKEMVEENKNLLEKYQKLVEENKNLLGEYQKLEKSNKKIKESKSWKMTKPLRKISLRVRNVFK